MMLCLLFYTLPAYSSEQNLIWPTPVVLEKGQLAKEDFYVYTENQFSQLLWLEAYYKIMERKWVAKENVYNEALKEASERLKPKFWTSFKGGFIVGICLFVASVWAVGQLK